MTLTGMMNTVKMNTVMKINTEVSGQSCSMRL